VCKISTVLEVGQAERVSGRKGRYTCGGGGGDGEAILDASLCILKCSAVAVIGVYNNNHKFCTSCLCDL
jgi:hypothetical protein